MLGGGRGETGISQGTEGEGRGEREKKAHPPLLLSPFQTYIHQNFLPTHIHSPSRQPALIKLLQEEYTKITAAISLRFQHLPEVPLLVRSTISTTEPITNHPLHAYQLQSVRSRFSLKKKERKFTIFCMAFFFFFLFFPKIISGFNLETIIISSQERNDDVINNNFHHN